MVFVQKMIAMNLAGTGTRDSDTNSKPISAILCDYSNIFKQYKNDNSSSANCICVQMAYNNENSFSPKFILVQMERYITIIIHHIIIL